MIASHLNESTILCNHKYYLTNPIIVTILCICAQEYLKYTLRIVHKRAVISRRRVVVVVATKCTSLCRNNYFISALWFKCMLLVCADERVEWSHDMLMLDSNPTFPKFRKLWTMYACVCDKQNDIHPHMYIYYTCCYIYVYICLRDSDRTYGRNFKFHIYILF